MAEAGEGSVFGRLTLTVALLTSNSTATVRELGALGNTAPLLNETEQLIKIIASLIKKGIH